MTSSTCHWDKAVRYIQRDVWSKRSKAQNSVTTPLLKGQRAAYSALYPFGPFPPFHCRVQRIRPVLTNTAGTMSRPNCVQFVTRLMSMRQSPTRPPSDYNFVSISPIALHLQPLSFASALPKPTNYDAHSAISLFFCCLYDQLFTQLHKPQYQIRLTVRPTKLFLQTSTLVHACHMQNHTRYW
jgi:hypothetical protein